MTNPIRDAAIEAAARYAWCEIHGYELDAWEPDTGMKGATGQWQGDLLRERWAPLVDAVLAVVGPAYRAEALRSFADSLGVNVGDEDGDWWQGYRQAQRSCLHHALDRADAEESSNG